MLLGVAHADHRVVEKAGVAQADHRCVDPFWHGRPGELQPVGLVVAGVLDDEEGVVGNGGVWQHGRPGGTESAHEPHRLKRIVFQREQELVQDKRLCAAVAHRLGPGRALAAAVVGDAVVGVFVGVFVRVHEANAVHLLRDPLRAVGQPVTVEQHGGFAAREQ